jgi:hypothetical protein
MTKRVWEIEKAFVKTLQRFTEEHIQAIDALLKTLSSKGSMSQAECEKFEAEFDALELHLEQQFNAARAKAKARGLVIH